MAANNKRPHIVEGNTPGKPVGKRHVQGISKRTLFQSEPACMSHQENPRVNYWTEAEESVLIQYLCLFWDEAYTGKWPTTKNMEFWNLCAEAVNSTCKSNRTGVYNLLLNIGGQRIVYNSCLKRINCIWSDQY